jgi:hypothetical protein
MASYPPLAEREIKNTIVLFDVEGTLTPPPWLCPPPPPPPPPSLSLYTPYPSHILT